MAPSRRRSRCERRSSALGGQKHRAPWTDIASAGPLGGYRLLNADGGASTYHASTQGGLYIPQPVEFLVGLAG